MTECIMPELLVLIPILVLIGKLLKNSKMKNNFIPFVLGIISIALSLCYVLGTGGMSLVCVFSGIVQGILCAGTAVYGNQIYKQGIELVDEKLENYEEGDI